MKPPLMLPSYLDAMLAAWGSGRSTRAVHFGLWDSPPGPQELQTPGAFHRAQARLDALALGLADVAPGSRVLDVGCGLGGTLEALNQAVRPLNMTGLNVDARQLTVCRSLQPAVASTMAWVQADACALPFAQASFENVLCVEAIFHFARRSAFLQEVARVLIRGGSLVLTDLRAQRPAGHEAVDQDVEMEIERDIAAAFGPWPEFWWDDSAPPPHEGSGLVLVQRLDITLHTLPTHLFTSPRGAPTGDPLARGCRALAVLHREGRLRVLAERYVHR